MHHLYVFHITKGLWLWLMHVYTFLLHIGGDVSSGDASQGVTPSVVNKEGTAMQALMQNPSKVEQESQAQDGYEIILTYFPTSLGAKFKPLFISFTYSRYDEEKVVWRADLTQEDAIGFCMERHDDEIMDVIQTAIIDDPHNEMVVHLTNPRHHGFIFSAFQIGESL